VCYADEIERRLIKKLLDGYDTDVRPVANHTSTLEVKMGIALNMIIDLYWTDAHLKWDQVEYGGIDVVRIKVSRIWRPDITLYNDVSDELPEIDEYFAAVTSDGYVTWLAPVIVMSSCPLDVTYFPWDQQVCTMTWGSWSFDGGKVNLYNRSSFSHLHAKLGHTLN
ncbi:hypothetical protein CAPTEDRAFT_218227, partial [Capitella teleta]